MHILEWLETVVLIQDFVVHAIEPASIEGHVEVLKWVIRSGYKLDAKKDYKHYLTAMKNSNLQALIWMNSRVPIFTTYMLILNIYACRERELEIVKWLYKNGYPCNDDSYHAARVNSHWRVKKWIHLQLFDIGRNGRRNNSLDIWSCGRHFI
jgi:hypothetical protein